MANYPEIISVTPFLSGTLITTCNKNSVEGGVLPVCSMSQTRATPEIIAKLTLS